MSRYLRILEKANLEKDLFGGLPEASSATEFPAAQELEEKAPPEPRERPAVTTPTNVKAEVKPVAAPVSEWRDELAQLLGLDGLPERTRIGMCPLGRIRSVAEAAAALGQWVATRSTLPVLIVEAGFDSPQAARVFRTRRLGLAEAMASREPQWDHFIHDTIYTGVKVLPAGRNPAMKQLLADHAGFRNALEQLDKMFDCVIVLLPNPLVSGFEKLVAADTMGIVFPVLEPGRVTARQAAQARRRLAAGAVRVAAALVSPGTAAGDAIRLEHIARQLERSSPGDLHA